MSEKVEDVLAAALFSTGSRYAFGVPGGGANLAMVGALADAGIEFVLGHGETAACIMASTYGHLTQSVAAAVVTRGPGAASAVNGAAQATLDRHPLVLVADTVAQSQRDRIPHQRIDQQAMLAPVTKGSFLLSASVSESTVAAVIALAQRWPRGCVHLDHDPTATATVSFDTNEPASPSTSTSPSPSTSPSTSTSTSTTTTTSAIRSLWGEADRPVFVVGAGAIDHAADVRATIERINAPAFTTYQAAGVLAADSPSNAGLFTNGASEQELLRQADLIVLVGLDMVEPIPKAWPYDAPVVSVAPIATLEPYAPIAYEAVGPIGSVLDEITEIGETGAVRHRWPSTAGQDFRKRVLADLRDHRQPGFGPVEAVDAAAAWASQDAALITTVDAGAHFLAVMPLWPTPEANRLLISNGLATMGYALPAAIGAALARPGHRVLAITGDGGLGMTLAELETLARLSLPVTVLVLNDATLSLIKIKQQPGQGGEGAVAYRQSDFAAIAAAQGVQGAVVETADELRQALDAPTKGPMLIDARISPAAYPHLIKVTRG